MSTIGIDTLRRQLREKFPQACGRGVAVAETARGGGEVGLRALEFPAGAVSEVTGTGAGWVVAGLLEGAADEPGAPELVLVDGADAFDPASYPAATNARLLWVRCRRSALEMVKAADWVVSDGNVPLVVMDAVGLDRRELATVPAAAWWRLRQAAERSGCRLVVVAAAPLVPAAACRWRCCAGVALADFAATRRELLERPRFTAERMRRAGG